MQKVAHELKLHHLDTPKIPLSNFSEISESVEAFNEMKDELCKYDKQTRKLNENLKNASLDTLYRLALAAEYKDNDTAQHIHRIGEYSEILARALNMSTKEIFIIKNASIMHDVGKLGISDSILLKPGKLTDEERKIMQTHSNIGKKILNNPSSEIMQAACEIASYHHEKYDGTGYPFKLKGENIPLMARVVAVVDVFDALVSKMCYKDPFSIEESYTIILNESGKHFDPKCVDAFKKSFDEILEIYNKYNHS
jgi:putative two-component system response regulator